MALLNQLFPELLPEDRAVNLRDHCEKVVPDHTYTKFLTEEELASRREEKINLDIKLSQQQQELADYNKTAKEEMKPLVGKASRLLVAVRDRMERCTGTVYVYRDEDTRMLGYYDDAGTLVFARRMTPEEMQGSLLSDIRISAVS